MASERTGPDSGAGAFVRELRRRRVFRTAGLYVVGAWLVMQAADVFFPGWGLPDAAINVLLVAAILGFPLALVFGWFFDITAHGIVRTPDPTAASGTDRLPLQRTDYAVLVALALMGAVIIYDAAREIMETPRLVETGIGEADYIAPEIRPENSIAVLTFANISEDPANEFFCDGISEEILNKLSGIDDLFVMARTSSFSFKGSEFGIRKISGLLGVRYLLQGSVRKHGTQLRISAQLVDESGAQRWSETFDRSMDNIFQIQSEIAEVVSRTILPKITQRPSPSFEPGTEAYGHFLAGRELLRFRDIDGAGEELQKAVELEPGYAEAHAELAIANLIGFVSDSKLNAANAAVDKALALQPGLPRALAARGLYLQQKRDPDWAGAEQVLRQALKADPNMVDAMNWLTNPLSMLGRRAESDAIMMRAYEIDPLNPTIAGNVAMRLARRGEVDRAEQMLLRLTELPRPSYRSFLMLSSLYVETGQFVRMNRLEKRTALSGLGIYFGLQFNYALLGRWQKAEEWTRLRNRDFPDHWFAGFNRANVPMWRGRYSKASRLLEEASSESRVDEADHNYFHYLFRGCARALSGQHVSALEILQPFVSMSDGGLFDFVYELLPHHCLAWSYLELGEREKALPILEYAETEINKYIDGSTLPPSGWVYLLAMNAVLMGDDDLAMERLGQAVDAGWRGYYVHINDPRWSNLSDDPRFRRLMIEVKADVDRQAEEVDRIDAEEDFLALLDAVIADRPAAQD
jgi:TolB-like protein/Tfp pilus assembly protein PilF